MEGAQNPYATVRNTTQTRRLAYVSVRGQAKQPYATLRRDYADPKFCFFLSTQGISVYSLRNSTQLYANLGVKAP